MRKTNKEIMISRVSKNVKIGVNQQEMLNDFNIRINKKLKEFNSSSETTREISFNEWLGGMMDSDGCFHLNEKKYLNCEITVPPREINSLYKIKSKFGGTISPRIGAKAIRLRLRNKKILIPFLLALNGNIHQKIDKYKQVMSMYIPDVLIKEPNFDLSGAWFSGFFEGDGCVYLCDQTYNIRMTIAQKNPSILEKIKNAFGGNFTYNKTYKTYVWEAANKSDLIKLFEYFTRYPLQSKKNADIISAKRFFRYKLLGYHLNKSKHRQLDHFIKLFRERRKI